MEAAPLILSIVFGTIIGTVYAFILGKKTKKEIDDYKKELIQKDESNR